MDIKEIYDITIAFIRCHTIIVICLGAALSIFIYYKPKAMSKIMMLAVGIGIIFYIISLIGESIFEGVQKKEEMGYKTKRLID
ncbi:MAG: hypothetical protein SWO11_11045 [Thermodesulfobacteriota bacterium]|nr:hypothetical protein [Thermodesulfobacteriota bacterium]